MCLVIVAYGGYGQTVVDVASQLNRYDEVQFFCDSVANAVGNCEKYQKYLDSDAEIYSEDGNNELHINWILQLLEEGDLVPP